MVSFGIIRISIEFTLTHWAMKKQYGYNVLAKCLKKHLYEMRMEK